MNSRSSKMPSSGALDLSCSAPDHALPRGGHRIACGARAGRLSFFGAGALVAVGYLDPGNWAAALGSGAKYGYAFLSVVIVASMMGILLQCFASRLGVVTGRDLAQLCRDRYSQRTTLALWVACEIAIIACDVAEVVGSAVALQLLIGVSLTIGVLMSAASTFAMLALQSHGRPPLQAIVTALTYLLVRASQWSWLWRIYRGAACWLASPARVAIAPLQHDLAGGRHARCSAYGWMDMCRNQRSVELGAALAHRGRCSMRQGPTIRP